MQKFRETLAGLVLAGAIGLSTGGCDYNKQTKEKPKEEPTQTQIFKGKIGEDKINFYNVGPSEECLEVEKSDGTWIKFDVKYRFGVHHSGGFHPEAFHPSKLYKVTVKKDDKDHNLKRGDDSVQDRIMNQYAFEFSLYCDKVLEKKLEKLK